MEKRNFISRWIDSAVSKSTTVPYECVSHDPGSYLKRNGKLKVVKKYLHKLMKLFLAGQLGLERKQAPENATILWLYTGKRNFGDANMELSGRALLKDRGVRIDLLTLPNLFHLFGEDDIFEKVYTDIKDVDPKRYDFIILSEFNHRSIRLKVKYFKTVPYACLFGFFDGPARNQTCFSFAGVNSVFKLGLTQKEIEAVAKPYVGASENTIESARKLIPDVPYIAISVGGIDPYRSYRHWPEFIHLYDTQGAPPFPQKIILVGSENGRDMSGQIAAETFSNVSVESYVGKLSILQTREIIANAIAFVGCDGGLLHVAHSTSTPSVSLFSAGEPHHLWLTRQCNSMPLQSEGEDSLIRPEDILARLSMLLHSKTSELRNGAGVRG